MRKKANSIECVQGEKTSPSQSLVLHRCIPVNYFDNACPMSPAYQSVSTNQLGESSSQSASFGHYSFSSPMTENSTTITVNSPHTSDLPSNPDMCLAECTRESDEGINYVDSNIGLFDVPDFGISTGDWNLDDLGDFLREQGASTSGGGTTTKFEGILNESEMALENPVDNCDLETGMSIEELNKLLFDASGIFPPDMNIRNHVLINLTLDSDDFEFSKEETPSNCGRNVMNNDKQADDDDDCRSTSGDSVQFLGLYNMAASIVHNRIDKSEKPKRDGPYRSRFLGRPQLRVIVEWFYESNNRERASKSFRAEEISDLAQRAEKSDAEVRKILRQLRSRYLNHKKHPNKYVLEELEHCRSAIQEPISDGSEDAAKNHDEPKEIDEVEIERELPKKISEDIPKKCESSAKINENVAENCEVPKKIEEAVVENIDLPKNVKDDVAANLALPIEMKEDVAENLELLMKIEEAVVENIDLPKNVMDDVTVDRALPIEIKEDVAENLELLMKIEDVTENRELSKNIKEDVAESLELPKSIKNDVAVNRDLPDDIKEDVAESLEPPKKVKEGAVNGRTLSKKIKEDVAKNLEPPKNTKKEVARNREPPKKVKEDAAKTRTLSKKVTENVAKNLKPPKNTKKEVARNREPPKKVKEDAAKTRTLSKKVTRNVAKNRTLPKKIKENMAKNREPAKKFKEDAANNRDLSNKIKEDETKNRKLPKKFKEEVTTNRDPPKKIKKGAPKNRDLVKEIKGNETKNRKLPKTIKEDMEENRQLLKKIKEDVTKLPKKTCRGIAPVASDRVTRSRASIKIITQPDETPQQSSHKASVDPQSDNCEQHTTRIKKVKKVVVHDDCPTNSSRTRTADKGQDARKRAQSMPRLNAVNVDIGRSVKLLKQAIAHIEIPKAVEKKLNSNSAKKHSLSPSAGKDEPPCKIARTSVETAEQSVEPYLFLPADQYKLSVLEMKLGMNTVCALDKIFSANMDIMCQLDTATNAAIAKLFSTRRTQVMALFSLRRRLLGAEDGIGEENDGLVAMSLNRMHEIRSNLLHAFEYRLHNGKINHKFDYAADCYKSSD